MCLFGFCSVKSKEYLKGVSESDFMNTEPYLVTYKFRKKLFSVINYRITSDHMGCLSEWKIR